MRSVAVLGHSNGFVKVSSELINMLGCGDGAAPGDGRTPEMRFVFMPWFLRAPPLLVRPGLDSEPRASGGQVPRQHKR